MSAVFACIMMKRSRGHQHLGHKCQQYINLCYKSICLIYNSMILWNLYVKMWCDFVSVTIFVCVYTRTVYKCVHIYQCICMCMCIHLCVNIWAQETLAAFWTTAIYKAWKTRNIKKGKERTKTTQSFSVFLIHHLRGVQKCTVLCMRQLKMCEKVQSGKVDGGTKVGSKMGGRQR